jgi:hypothetical protein
MAVIVLRTLYLGNEVLIWGFCCQESTKWMDPSPYRLEKMCDLSFLDQDSCSTSGQDTLHSLSFVWKWD